MNIPDLFFTIILIAFVQYVAYRTCRKNKSITHLHPFIAAGLIAWALFAFTKDTVSADIMHVRLGDTLAHDRHARSIAEDIETYGFMQVFNKEAEIGNRGYRFFIGTIYYATGVTSQTIYLFNGMMAAWGGIILLDILIASLGISRPPKWILLLTVFFPSTIFWTTNNLKEGLMYWSICMAMSVLASKEGKASNFKYLGYVIAAITMIAFRPHIATIWLSSIALVFLIKKGKRAYVLLLLVLLPSSFSSLSEYTGWMDERGTIEILEETHDRHASNYSRHGSTVIDSSHKPVYFLTGISFLLMRPYIWEINSFRYAVTSLEIWSVLILLIYAWIKIRRSKRKILFINNIYILLGVIVVANFAFMFSFWGNLGLLARYRIQAIPAILVILLPPLLINRRGGHNLTALQVGENFYQAPEEHAAQGNNIALRNQ
jgi:hypothetical protein